MILVDTSVWIDHLRQSEPRLEQLLTAFTVRTHAFVIGQLALGHMRNRKSVLDLLQNLPRTPTAPDSEVLLLIERFALNGLGMGYVDSHLLASARLSPGTRIWTRDKRLARISDRLGLSFAG